MPLEVIVDSILNTIKHMLGPSEGYEYFDTDIIININNAFSRLTQLGVGPASGFRISDDTSTWEEFVTDQRLEAVKEYVYLKVRLGFDPPANSAHISLMKEQIAELEWELNVVAETPCFNE